MNTTSPSLKSRRGAGQQSAIGDDTFELWRDAPNAAATIFDPMGIILFVRRNLIRIGVTAALVGATTFGATLLIFNKYLATAVVLVDPRSAKVTQAGGVLSNIGSDAIAIESLVQVTKTEGFLGRLVDKLGLAQDPNFAANRAAAIAKLRALLNVARRGETYVIEATAASPSAEESAKIANAAAQMIIDDQSDLRSGASETTATSIESRLAEVSGRVNRAEEAAAELKSKLKVTDAGQGATLLERRVSELNQQLVLAAAKTGEARARIDQLRKAGATAGDNLPPTIQSSVLDALRVEFDRLSRQSSDQSTVLGARHPEVVSLNAQLSDVRRQIRAEIAHMMATAQTEFLEAEQQETSLAGLLKETQDESGDLGSQLVKLGELEREAKAERDVYEELLTRQRELVETKNLEPDDIRIVSPALPPTKTTPGKAMLAAAASLIGLLAGLAYGLAREAIPGTLKTTRQAERFLGVGVGGLVPAVNNTRGFERAGQRHFDVTPWLADLCSALALDRGRAGSVIFVTSSQRDEGRSTIAANIAAHLARTGEQVLLVEADRARLSNRRPGFGLIDVLALGTDLQRAFVEREADGYTFLPFGGRNADKTNSQSALMSGITLRAALRLCRSWFDFVVIDGPPVLDSGHTGFLARQANQTVFVVEWDKTSRANVIEALERLVATQTTLILNKVDIARYRLLEPAQSYRLATQAEDVSRAA